MLKLSFVSYHNFGICCQWRVVDDVDGNIDDDVEDFDNDDCDDDDDDDDSKSFYDGDHNDFVDNDSGDDDDYNVHVMTLMTLCSDPYLVFLTDSHCIVYYATKMLSRIQTLDVDKICLGLCAFQVVSFLDSD